MRPLEDEAGHDSGSARPPSGRALGERGGVLLRVSDGEGVATLGFVPAEVARKLAALSSFTVVPGALPEGAGIALADGAVVTVLRIGKGGIGGVGAAGGRSTYEPGEDWLVPGANRALLCDLGGFDVALTGGIVLATGVFDAAPGGDGILWRGDVVPLIDVRALYAQAEAVTWAERAALTRPKGASIGPSPPSASIPAPTEPARGSQPHGGDAAGRPAPGRWAGDEAVASPDDDAGRQAILPEAPAHGGERGKRR